MGECKMAIHMDSICPNCSHVNHVHHNGAESLNVKCDHCPRVYEHVVYPVTNVQLLDEKISSVKEMVVEKHFSQMSAKSVVCLIILNNGYEVEGKATVKDEKEFKLIVGKDVAYEKALRRAVVALGAIFD
jgi:hypothetical protein